MSMSTYDALDELSYDHEEDGVLVRKQLERVVLAQGAWATVMFLFQELDRETGSYRAPRMSIVRFQKWRGAYRKQSSFNISSEEQARQLTGVLQRWSVRLTASEPESEPDDERPDDRGDTLGAEG